MHNDALSQALAERAANSPASAAAVLHAIVRKSSKYYSQNNFKEGPHVCAGTPIPFPVVVGHPSCYSDYVVDGNGNKYRLEDLTFFMPHATTGKLIKLGSGGR